MLYKEFIRYIQTGQILKGRSRLLLAVSGGADSVVLLHLFHQLLERGAYIDGLGSPLVLGIAHCNFHLRGEESNRDENFVRELASRYRLPLHCISFDTEAYAREHRLSIEMAARELRYGFFSRLMQGDEPENPAYDACVLAHHADDNAETFFINLFRGSGVKGLRGMLPVSVTGKGEVYLRPLLFARRNQIEAYARAHSLEYVTDSTNQEEIYLRNKIRHTVLPVLENICEGFSEKLTQSMGTLRAVDSLLDEWYEKQESFCVIKMLDFDHDSNFQGFSSFMNKYGHSYDEVKYGEFIPSLRLESLGLHKNLFLELYLRQRGFNRGQIFQILENINRGESGKFFENVDHSVFLLRESLGWRCLFLETKKHSLDYPKPVEKDTELTVLMEKEPLCRQYSIERLKKCDIDKSQKKVYLNYGMLQFPLRWRHWCPGDRFKPLGMKGFKKLSDFFKDVKIGMMERDAVWLLCSGDDIVWVAGYRLDERYKIVFPIDSNNDSSESDTFVGKVWVVELL